MTEFLDQPVRKLSLGQRMRGDIAASLLHDPPILYLDEPTIGMDVVAKNRLLEHLQLLATERGVTIILTTHALSDVDRICRRIILIDHGHVVLDDDRSRLLEMFGSERVLELEFEGSESAAAVFPGSSGDGLEVALSGNRINVTFDTRRQSVAGVLGRFAALPGLYDVHLHEENIETIVTRFYENRSHA